MTSYGTILTACDHCKSKFTFKELESTHIFSEQDAIHVSGMLKDEREMRVKCPGCGSIYLKSNLEPIDYSESICSDGTRKDWVDIYPEGIYLE